MNGSSDCCESESTLQTKYFHSIIESFKNTESLSVYESALLLAENSDRSLAWKLAAETLAENSGWKLAVLQLSPVHTIRTRKWHARWAALPQLLIYCRILLYSTKDMSFRKGLRVARREDSVMVQFQDDINGLADSWKFLLEHRDWVKNSIYL